jgi:hypothetical protein
MLSVASAAGQRRDLGQMGQDQKTSGQPAMRNPESPHELGARRADVGQGAEATWVVMADPDGNEFCVLRAFTAGELATF